MGWTSGGDTWNNCFVLDVIRDGDLGQHFTLNISGVDKLEFSLVKPEVEVAICEVALWTNG